MKQYSMVKGCQKGDKEEEEKEEMRVCVCTCVNANTLILFGSYYMLECLCAPREPSSGWMFSHWCREASGRCLSGRRDQRHLVQGRGCMNVGNPPASSELQYRVTKKKCADLYWHHWGCPLRWIQCIWHIFEWSATLISLREEETTGRNCYFELNYDQQSKLDW